MLSRLSFARPTFRTNFFDCFRPQNQEVERAAAADPVADPVTDKARLAGAYRRSAQSYNAICETEQAFNYFLRAADVVHLSDTAEQAEAFDQNVDDAIKMLQGLEKEDQERLLPDFEKALQQWTCHWVALDQSEAHAPFLGKIADLYAELSEHQQAFRYALQAAHESSKHPKYTIIYFEKALVTLVNCFRQSDKSIVENFAKQLFASVLRYYETCCPEIFQFAVLWAQMGTQYRAFQIYRLAARSFAIAADCYSNTDSPPYEFVVRYYKKAGKDYSRSSSDYRQAAQMYKTAAACTTYLLNSRYSQLRLYMKAAQLYAQTLPAEYKETFSCFWQASRAALALEDPQEASRCLVQAATLSYEEVRFATSSEALIDIASRLESLAEELMALSEPLKAAQCFEWAAQACFHLYCGRDETLNFCSHHSRANLNDRSSEILMQYPSRLDRSNLPHSENPQNSKFHPDRSIGAVAYERVIALRESAAQQHRDSYNWLQAALCYERCVELYSKLEHREIGQVLHYTKLIRECWTSELCCFLYPICTVDENFLVALYSHAPQIGWLLDTILLVPEKKRPPLLAVLRTLGLNARHQEKEVCAMAKRFTDPSILPDEGLDLANFLRTLGSCLRDNGVEMRHLIDAIFAIPVPDRNKMYGLMIKLQLPHRDDCEDVQNFISLWDFMASLTPLARGSIFLFLGMLTPHVKNHTKAVREFLTIVHTTPERLKRVLFQSVQSLSPDFTRYAQILGGLLELGSTPSSDVQQFFLCLQSVASQQMAAAKELIGHFVETPPEERGDLMRQILLLSSLLKPQEYPFLADIANVLKAVVREERVLRVERIRRFWDPLKDIFSLQHICEYVFYIPSHESIVDPDIFYFDRDFCLSSPQKNLLLLRGLVSLLKGHLPKYLEYGDKEGVDRSGVTRDIIAELFKSLYAEEPFKLPARIEEEGILPHMRDPLALSSEEQREQIGCYEAMGMVFSFALRSIRSLRVGVYFDPLLFRLIYSLSEKQMEQIDEIPLNLKISETKYAPVYNDLLSLFLRNHSCKCAFGETAEEIRFHVDLFIQQKILPSSFQEAGIADAETFLQTYNIHSILCAALCIAKGIYFYRRSYSWHVLKGPSVDYFSTKIQGVVSKKRVLDALRWEQNYAGLVSDSIADWKQNGEKRLLEQYAKATLWIPEGVFLEWLHWAPASELQRYLQIIQQLLKGEPCFPALEQNLKCVLTQRFLQDWIQQIPKEERKQFLQAATGSPSLARHRHLHIHLYEESENLADFRSCINSMNLPSGYLDFATFKKKMEHAISCVRDGFQVE